jgi:hypothetical protein
MVLLEPSAGRSASPPPAKRWGGVGGGGCHFASHNISDNGQNAVDISDDIVVPKSKDAIALIAQIGIAVTIAFSVNAIAVMAAIELDHHARGVTGEIRKVWTEWRLTSEVHAVNRQAAKVLPKLALNIGRVATQSTCSRCTLVRPYSHCPPPPTPSHHSLRSRGEGSR